jgi:hypothetical protein
MRRSATVTAARALAALQRRFAAALLPARRDGGGRAAVASAARLLESSAHRSAAVGLAVYRDGCAARFASVLRSDFPCVAGVLGDDRFDDVVRRYVAAHPSRHPNLNQLGRELPAFLRRRGPAPQRLFVAELAALERAMAEAADAPECTPLTNEALARVAPGEWPDAVLVLDPSLRLLAFRHPVQRCYEQWLDGERIAAPPPERSWLAVSRRGDRILRLPLSRAAHAFLRALAAGRPFGEALAATPARESVAERCREFAAAGLFAAVSVRRRADGACAPRPGG